MNGTCPGCGNATNNLIPIETGKRLALNLDYVEACSSCHDILPEKVSQSFKLTRERELKEEHKIKLWKNRTSFIEKGRLYFKQKAYGKAALQYEEYIKILEVVHNVDQLTPEVFSSSSKSKELTIVTSVFWELIRIYDTSNIYTERLHNAVRQLTEFAPYSPIFPDLVKKAEIFYKQARNPQALKPFLAMANSRKAGCFIATAAFDTGFSEEVKIFRHWRDHTLKKSTLGQQFIRFYYFVSPSLARFINRYALLKPLVRMPLIRFANYINRSSNK